MLTMPADGDREQGARGEIIAPSALDNDGLQNAIQAQRRLLEASEQALSRARERVDADARRLRQLEDEQRRRTRVAAGLPSEVTPAGTGRKKRSTTGMDALRGRDGIQSDVPFDSFRFLSLNRQEIILDGAGRRDAQAIAFVNKESGDLIEARTFGEARLLMEAGHALGRPGVPLQRQAIWYAEQGKAGWLRLDQVFVEKRAEIE
jgi:hypothetical protein